jgi:two-component SAPR family response regulator
MMKNILPVVGLMALAYSIYKNVTQDKEISLLKTDLAQHKKALSDLQSNNKIDATYQIAMKQDKPNLFPKDVLMQTFDARKNATVSSPSTIITI